MKQCKIEDDEYRQIKCEINGFIKYFYLELKNKNHIKKSGFINLAEVPIREEELIKKLLKSMLKNKTNTKQEISNTNVLSGIVNKAYKKNISYEDLKKEFENDEVFKVQIIKIVRRRNRKNISENSKIEKKWEEGKIISYIQSAKNLKHVYGHLKGEHIKTNSNCLKGTDEKINIDHLKVGGKKNNLLDLEEIKAKEIKAKEIFIKVLTSGVVDAGNNLRILCGEYINPETKFWKDHIGAGEVEVDEEKLERQKEIYGQYYLRPIIKEENYKENVESITRFIMNIRHNVMHYRSDMYEEKCLSEIITENQMNSDKKIKYEEDKARIKIIYDKFINKEIVIKDSVHKLLSTNVLKHYDEDDLLNIVMKGLEIENKDSFKAFPRYDKIKNIIKDRFEWNGSKWIKNEYEMEQYEIKLFEYVYNAIYRYEKNIKITREILKKVKSEFRESIVEEMRDKKYSDLPLVDFYEEGQKQCGNNGDKLKQFNSYYNELVGQLFFEFLCKSSFDGTTSYRKIKVVEIDGRIENKKALKNLEDKKNRLEKKLMAKQINVVTIESELEYKIFALYLMIGNKNISSINNGFKKYMVTLEKIKKYKEDDEIAYNELKDSIKKIIEVGKILIDTKDKIKDSEDVVKKEIDKISREYFKEYGFMNYKITVDGEERGFYADEKNLIKFNKMSMFEKYGQDSYLKNLLKNNNKFKICKKDFETYEKYLNKKIETNIKDGSEKIKTCEEIVKESRKNGNKNLIVEIIECRNNRLKEIKKGLDEIKEDKKGEKRKAYIEKNVVKYNEIVKLNNGVVEYSYYKNKIQFTLYKSGIDFIEEILKELNAKLVEKEKDEDSAGKRDMRNYLAHNTYFPDTKYSLDELIEYVFDELSYSGDRQTEFVKSIKKVFARNGMEIKVEIEEGIKGCNKPKMKIKTNEIKALSVKNIKKIKPDFKKCKNAVRIDRNEMEFYKAILKYKEKSEV